MTRLAKMIIFVLIVGVLVIISISLDRGGAAPMALLQSHGYATNQTAVFLFTNPGPGAVEYFAHQEQGRTTSVLTNGVLAGHTGLSFYVPLSQSPTRLIINCSAQRTLRDLLDELRSTVGLQVQPRHTEYTLFSEELKK